MTGMTNRTTRLRQNREEVNHLPVIQIITMITVVTAMVIEENQLDFLVELLDTQTMEEMVEMEVTITHTRPAKVMVRADTLTEAIISTGDTQYQQRCTHGTILLV
jgi:hypothetical protein